MAKMKPNAGPWSYECTLGSVTIKDADGLAVAQARPRKDGWNAELLAAAPELFAALSVMLGRFAHHEESEDDGFGNALGRAKAALLKAMGGVQ